jgi:hypothetical protein
MNPKHLLNATLAALEKRGPTFLLQASLPLLLLR